LSSGSERSAFTLFLLLILVAVPLYAIDYNATRPPGEQQGPAIAGLQLRSTSVEIAGVSYGGPNLDVRAVVYNPDGFGATLNEVNYSVWADGHYLGSGQTAQEYYFAPLSTTDLTFPISIGWTPAFQTAERYFVGWGDVTWEVRGTASVEVGGLHFTTSFEFATG
jgi:LEA14-like dessication related protein